MSRSGYYFVVSTAIVFHYRLSAVELRHLRYFVAVAEDLSYRKAAERLHVSQPALSKQIKDLESELNVRLLDRDTHGVRMTEAGVAFLAEARLTLRQSDHAVTAAQKAVTGRHGRLAIGYVEPVLMGFMPTTLLAFHKKFPEVDISLIEIALDEQLSALRDGTLQVGFAQRNGRELPQTLQRIPVASSPICAVVSRTHPLAKATRVSLADLRNEPLVSLKLRRGIGSLHGEIMTRLFAAHGVKVQKIMLIQGAEPFRAFLEGGLGVSLVPKIGGLSRSSDLVFKTLCDTGLDLCLELDALWCDVDTAQLARKFIAVVRQITLEA